MRIAFVGKGGSGKSTLSSLFTTYLLSQDQKVLIVDADLNIHVPKLLGIDIESSKALSLDDNTASIRKYLMGKNKRIKEVAHFYKTTPPGEGSNFLELKDSNELITKYAKKFAQQGYCMIVGTYEEEGVGVSCYHTNLSVFENILTHALLQKNEWIVADMVAGIDAFSNTLHAQFDALFLVVEPTLESVEVFNQYQKLGEHAGINDHLYVIGNKIEDETDIVFLRKHIGDKLLGVLHKNNDIKQRRQKGDKLSLDSINEEGLKLFKEVADISLQNQLPEDVYLKRLYGLHKKYVAQEYVTLAVGDISDQIDPDFKFSNQKRT